VYPTLVPLALLTGGLLAAWSRRASVALARWVVPVALACGALVFWTKPQWLGRDTDAPFKAQASTLRTILPQDVPIPLLGGPSWRLSNPLMYYDGLEVGETSVDVAAAVTAASRLPRPLLLVENARRDALAREGPPTRTVAELRLWQLVELTDDR
jgi:hypothetical protein